MDPADTQTETEGVLTALGWLLACAGVLMVAAGVVYAQMGWRYGGFIAIWSAQWGLPLFGVGFGLSRFRRRGTGIVAVATGLVASSLIVLGRVSHGYASYSVTLVIDAAAVLIGVASAIRRRRSRSSRGAGYPGIATAGPDTPGK